MHTLTYSSTTLTLPADLAWTDEYAWRAVEQTRAYTITGAQVVQAFARQSGRPITLSGGPDRAWITRTQLETLRAWAALPGQTFSLVVRGAAARTVAFDHDAGAMEAEPVFADSDVADGDFYTVKLRFFEA